LIRTDLLRGKIAEKGFSQTEIAGMLGITSKSFYNKMAKGVFKSNEMYKLYEILDIENPVEIFFAKEVTPDVTIKEGT
jgi:transcriptional regulator with XRE-family HTH domain